MPWSIITLNDGSSIPDIAYGTWRLQDTAERVSEALATGLRHIDTAEAYKNETETGEAIKRSGLPRSEIFITTKYAAIDGLEPEVAIQNSLKRLGIDYVDLYLVHNVRHAIPDIPTFWKKMEKLRADGFAKSIGVSNFKLEHLVQLERAEIKPVVNQIMFHPYLYEGLKPLLEYCAKNRIVVEGYSPMIPLVHVPVGKEAAITVGSRHSVGPEQVLLAWSKSKGVIPVTSSSKKERMESYRAAGDLELTAEDITALDAAGAEGATAWEKIWSDYINSKLPKKS